jgi:hypothetical protein
MITEKVTVVETAGASLSKDAGATAESTTFNPHDNTNRQGMIIFVGICNSEQQFDLCFILICLSGIVLA